MSNVDLAASAPELCEAGGGAPVIESYPAKTVSLGAIPVMRALPVRQRRMVGPWCFLDRFGPMTFDEDKPMDVAPHPHIGLQTVTWLLDGEVLHDDSLGCQAIARPGGVNVMTAGAGIAHAEQTPGRNSHRLDGVQLWVALPEALRHGAASFAAIERVPELARSGGLARVFAGAMDGEESGAPHFSEILGADLEVHTGAEMELGLRPGWEHAVLVLRGEAMLEGNLLAPGQLHYLGAKRSRAAFRNVGQGEMRLLLIGGPPFPERILMWWNFVARTPEEMAAAREDWLAQRRFGEVAAYRGARLGIPELVRIAQR
jgi:redox-sensitive bicupin YhaK (pirin superfamily)